MTGRLSWHPYQPPNRLWVYCSPCGKRGFTSRRGAKLSLKDLVREKGDKASHLDVFVCPDNDTLYHVGHNYSSRGKR